MLSMQTLEQKARIFAEARRLLAPEADMEFTSCVSGLVLPIQPGGRSRLRCRVGAKSSTIFSPVGFMSDCHRRIEMFMRVLSAAAGFAGRRLNEGEKHSPGGCAPIFREVAAKHHADEEESLFPRLRPLPHLEVRRAPGDIGRLEQEHHWAARLHREVDRLGQE
jgi:hypothetical protein